MKPLKYSMMTLCHPNLAETPEGLVDYAVKHGLKGIDWSMSATKGATPEHIRRICDDNGLEITDFIPWPMPFARRDPDGFDLLRREMEFAAAIGAPMSLVPTPTPEKDLALPRAERQKIWMELLHQSTALCVELGIIPLIESFAGGPGPFISADELIECKRQIPELQFAYDPGNIITAGVDPVQEYRKLKAYAPVIYGHLKDIRLVASNDDGGYAGLDGRYYRECSFGKGIIDLDAIIAELENDKDFDGWLNIEATQPYLEDSIKFLQR